MLRNVTIGLLCLGLLWALGCNGKPPGPKTTGGETDEVVEADDGGDDGTPPEGGDPGTLTGRITFEGTPEIKTIQVNKDVAHCKGAEGKVTEVTVGKDGGLADVFVEITEVEHDGGWNHPADGYVIRQKGCRFHPHVLAVPEGANVKVHNDDDVGHNANCGMWNFAQQAKGPMQERQVARAGRPFLRLNCNIHSWMEAWIYVPQSPLYARTGKDGKFTIGNIPPGTYTVTYSHHRLGTQEFEIEIKAKETTSKDVTFESE